MQVTALARIVGGDQLELTGLLKANVDPHAYEPTPEDAKALAHAQLIVINGVGLEAWFEKLIKASGSQAVIVDTSQGITLRQRSSEDGKTEADPHIWHSASNVVSMVNNIRDGLSKADATKAETYKANAAAYEKKLNELDQYIKQQLATVPAANRKLVTNHETFGYYAERYGLRVIGSIIPSMDTNFQPSAKDVAELVKKIKTESVKAIFTEPSINPALAQQIAREAGVKVVTGLYGDTLGPAGSGADTVDGMLKHNTDLMVASLR